MYGQPNPYQGSGLPMDFYNPANQSFNNPISGMMTPHSGNMGDLIIKQQQQQVPQPLMNGVPVDPRQFETPEIVMNDEKTHRPKFTVSDSKSNTITVDIESDAEIKERKRKKKEGRASSLPRALDKSDSSTGIVVSNESNNSVSGEVVDSTIYTYGETTNLLHETLGQIDAINGELVQEFNAVRRNRTMKNKYNVLIGISENIGSMLNNRLSAIKEINNCISKSNEMDYKKYKDREAMQATMNDDKYISDIYQAFLQNPAAQPTNYNLPEYNPNAYGSGIVRANIVTDNSGTQDIGYLNYIAGLTPEQNLMRYEKDPDVKQVVVYDPNTGNRFFQVMNTRTGEVIPNVPVYGEDIMADTVLNTNTGIAKNINLNETFPIVTINGSVASQY